MRIVKQTILFLIAASTAASASSYRVHIIDPLPGNNFAEAFSINNSGSVLVSSSSAPNDTRGAFIWNAQIGIVTVFAQGTVDFPQKINNNEQVVGIRDDGHSQSAVIYNSNGTLTNLASLTPDIGSWATAINDKGQAVGYSGDKSHAVMWDANGTPTNISGSSGQLSSAADINFEEEVVWNSMENLPTGLVSSAYRWISSSSSTLLNPLETNDYTVANAINDKGIAVGQSGNNAVLWGTDNTAINLGSPGSAKDINIGMQIVGVMNDSAVLWNSDLTTINLGALVDSDYSCALGINDNGWIVGYADIAGMRRAVLWQPVPEPSSLFALIGGVVGLGGIARRWRKM